MICVTRQEKRINCCDSLRFENSQAMQEYFKSVKYENEVKIPSNFIGTIREDFCGKTGIMVNRTYSFNVYEE